MYTDYENISKIFSIFIKYSFNIVLFHNIWKKILLFHMFCKIYKELLPLKKMCNLLVEEKNMILVNIYCN
jgi:hypothetical protein